MVTSTVPVATCSWTWRSPTPTCFSDLPSTRLTSHVQIAPSLCMYIGQFFASCPFIIDTSCFSVFLPRSKMGKNIHRCARRWSCWNTSDIWAKCQRLGSAFFMSKMSQTSFLSDDVKFSEWKTWASKLWFQLKTHCNDGQIEGYSSYHSHSAVKKEIELSNTQGFCKWQMSWTEKRPKTFPQIVFADLPWLHLVQIPT